MSLVSVVIPTRRRPELLRSAIDSVLEQDGVDLECIVVVDGPEPETLEMLAGVTDDRVRVIALPECVGGSQARNTGIDAARGDWIAFLDDDDDWLPCKLQKQLDGRSPDENVLISCLSYVITRTATFIWPRRIHDDGTSMGDYLFDRRSLLVGDTFLQTSSYVLPTRLARAVRFRALARHEDWDFLLRLFASGTTRLHTVAEPLVRYRTDDDRGSLGRGGHWRESLAWVDTVRDFLSPRAYSGFCLTVVGPRVRATGRLGPALLVIGRAFRSGAPTLAQIVVFASLWCTPRAFRAAIRGFAVGVRVGLRHA